MSHLFNVSQGGRRKSGGCECGSACATSWPGAAEVETKIVPGHGMGVMELKSTRNNENKLIQSWLTLSDIY